MVHSVFTINKNTNHVSALLLLGKISLRCIRLDCCVESTCMHLIAQREICYMEHHDTFKQVEVDDLHLLKLNLRHASFPPCHIAI
jgi:hypothetical protein